MLSVEETRALSRVHPEFDELMKKDPDSPLLKAWDESTDLSSVRAAMQGFKEAMERSRPDPSSVAYTEEDVDITVRDGARITLRVHRPKAAPPTGCPGMVMFHGGGFVVGNLEVNADLAHMFTEMGGIAVDVDYRHAPEHPFPVPIHDCLDALRWAVAHSQELGISPERGLLVGGESAGADIAMAVAHLYREDVREGRPRLTGLFAPLIAVVTKESVPEKYRERFISMEQNADAPVLSASSLAFIRNMYKPQATSALAAPLLFDHIGIPKTYFQACGWDPTRDCSLVAEQVWRDAGILTRLDVYPGLPHVFWAVMPGSQVSRQRRQDCAAALRWLLEP